MTWLFSLYKNDTYTPHATLSYILSCFLQKTNKQTSKKRLIWFRHAGYLSVLRGGTHRLVNLCNWSLTEWLAKWDVTSPCQLITKWGESGFRFHNEHPHWLPRDEPQCCPVINCWSVSYITFLFASTTWSTLCKSSECLCANINNILAAVMMKHLIWFDLICSFIFPNTFDAHQPIREREYK